MKHQYRKIAAVAALCLVMVSALVSCRGFGTEEEHLRKIVTEAVQAAEAKHVARFMRHVAPSYTDDYGNDYESVRAILFAEFMKPGAIKVFVTKLDIEVSGMVARVEAKAVIVRGADLSAIKSVRDVIPDEADAFEISLIFTNDGSKWRVVGGNWQPVGLAGLL